MPRNVPKQAVFLTVPLVHHLHFHACLGMDACAPACTPFRSRDTQHPRQHVQLRLSLPILGKST